MKNILALLIVVITAVSAVAGGADIGSLPWNRANVATLRSLSKSDVVGFLNEQNRKVGVPVAPITPNEIGQFEWADLAGNGHYRLLLTFFEPCVDFIDIADRDASGRVRGDQTIRGWADLKTDIRDLNGDGKDELIIEKPLAEYNCADVITWPAVYRPEKGKYVEASQDFSAFYDKEVLPKLGAEIRQYKAKSAEAAKAGHANRWNPAGLIMARDKILRVLGRDPTAGLHQAYQWMNSDDPYLLLDAEVTLKEIGGHQEEVKAASAAYDRALCKRHPAMVMCRNLPQH